MSSKNLDTAIVNFFNTPNPIVNGFYHFFSVISSVIVCLIVIIVFDKTPYKINIIALLVAAIFIWALKPLSSRPRPFMVNRNIVNRDIFYINGIHSFPSLQVASITILSLMFYYDYNIPVIFPLLPIIVIISRLGLGAHYTTDCLFSFILATILYVFIRMLSR